MSTDSVSDRVLALTAGIVSSYVAKHPVSRETLPDLVARIHGALGAAAGPGPAPAADVTETHKPFVPVKRSVHKDHLVCLVCGASFKSLKRHLSTSHDLSPGDYRSRYGLAPDYPMVAPDYAASRSALAIELGLGRKGPAARRAKGAGAKRK